MVRKSEWNKSRPGAALRDVKMSVQLRTLKLFQYLEDKAPPVWEPYFCKPCGVKPQGWESIAEALAQQVPSNPEGAWACKTIFRSRAAGHHKYC